jgi:L-rhamnose isomerase/sugar isomerase
MSAASSLLPTLANAIEKANKQATRRHDKALKFLTGELAADGLDAEAAIQKLVDFDLAAPSWALGSGGTRFGKFPIKGEPTNLDEKVQDLTALRQLVGSTKSISIHIPWDIPQDAKAFKQACAAGGLTITTVNSNTFQDQPGQKYSYKYGSVSHTDARVRQQAIDHNLECVEIGKQLGSKFLSVWLPDGGNHPGQQDLRGAADRVIDSLKKVYAKMPKNWVMYTEHKPFEPAFYSTVVSDWGASWMIAQEIGERCRCLVDLGHHLQATNIEQVVAYLLRVGRLGGFHFNDAKYADDDLTTGSIRPFLLFLVFNELVLGAIDKNCKNPEWTYMIDESHNIKDPIEDLVQAVDAIQRAYAQALIVDRKGMALAQQNNDATMAQELLQKAFRTDVGPLVREARRRLGGAVDPLAAYRASGYRKLTAETRAAGVATGL